MMLALFIGWMTLGFGVRMTCVVMGGIGFRLFLDEVGKFLTKDDDYVSSLGIRTSWRMETGRFSRSAGYMPGRPIATGVVHEGGRGGSHDVRHTRTGTFAGAASMGSSHPNFASAVRYCAGRRGPRHHRGTPYGVGCFDGACSAVSDVCQDRVVDECGPGVQFEDLLADPGLVDEFRERFG